MPMKNPAHPGRIVRSAALSLWDCPSPKARSSWRHPANAQQRHQREVGHQPRDGYPALEGVRQHAGNVATDAACL